MQLILSTQDLYFRFAYDLFNCLVLQFNGNYGCFLVIVLRSFYHFQLKLVTFFTYQLQAISAGWCDRIKKFTSRIRLTLIIILL